MAYDFLGTMGRSQWLLLRAFAENTVLDVLGPTPEDGSDREVTGLMLNLQASICKVEKGLAELDKASLNFNGYQGDQPFLKEQEPTKPRLRHKLSDADTSQVMVYLKRFQIPQLKRKKENIEYRVKRYLDVLDQLERRLVLLSEIDTRVEKWLSTVETHFNSPLHTHHLKRGEILNDQGYIDHTRVSLVVENKPEAQEYLDDAAEQNSSNSRNPGGRVSNTNAAGGVT